MSTVTFSTVLLRVPLNASTHAHEQTTAWLLADLAVAPAFGDDYCACILCLLRRAKTLGPKVGLNCEPRSCEDGSGTPIRKISCRQGARRPIRFMI